MPKIIFFEGYEDLRSQFGKTGEIFSLAGVTENFNIAMRSFPTKEALDDVIRDLGINIGQWQEISSDVLRESGFNTLGLR